MAFKDSNAQVVDKSYTMSYYPAEPGRWLAFHDYIPDSFIGVRDQLYSIKDRTIYVHNTGNYGQYYENTVKASYVTLVFPSPYVEANTVIAAMVEACVYICEITDNTGKRLDKPITTISFQNSYQGTGVMPAINYDKSLSLGVNFERARTKRISSNWNFSDIKHRTSDADVPFRETVTDFIESLEVEKEFQERTKLIDRYVIVKLLFDNKDNLCMNLYSVDIKTTQVE